VLEAVQVGGDLVGLAPLDAEQSTRAAQEIARERVIIARAGKPIARLTRLAGAAGPVAPNGVRFGGLSAKRLKLAPDFHAPMTDTDLLGS
jgi:hypothetical protein